MNWGYKIMAVIMVFITAMGTMITIAMRQKNDLVDEQYYVRELRHQELIDAGRNLQALPGNVQLLREQGALTVRIPKAAASDVTASSLSLICPSDKSRDRILVFLPDAEGAFRVSAKEIPKGTYLVRLNWKSGTVPYYYEQSLRVD
ncbi:MAG TPA: FixH family protein [Chitinophagaceae bacterium]|nr:FixH family protein [Chitinophagaceae bacterium]